MIMPYLLSVFLVTNIIGIVNLQYDKGMKVLSYKNLKMPDKKRIAYIIIGIDDYKSDSIPDLKYAVNDAAEFKKLVEKQGIDTSKMEINVYTFTDSMATRENILSALRNTARDADMVVIFFSGYGYGEALVPYDAFLPGGLITFPDIIGAVGSKKLVIFADCCLGKCCYSGISYLKYLSIVGNNIWIFSYPECGMEKPDLKHGILSYYLLKAFSGEADYNEDGVISTLELSFYFNSIDSKELEPSNRPAAIVGRLNNPLPVFYLSGKR